MNAEIGGYFPYIKHDDGFRGVGETKFNKPCRLVVLGGKQISGNSSKSVEMRNLRISRGSFQFEKN